METVTLTILEAETFHLTIISIELEAEFSSSVIRES